MSRAVASVFASRTRTGSRSRSSMAWRGCRRSRCTGRRSISARTKPSAPMSFIIAASSAARRMSSAWAILSCTPRNIEKTVGWYREMFGFPADLGRGLCRRQDQHHGVIQPARPWRRLCRSPCLLLHPQRQIGAQPLQLRGGRYRRHHDRPRARFAQGKGYPEHFWGLGRHSLGSRGFMTTGWGDPLGSGCTSIGPTPDLCSTPACRPT